MNIKARATTPYEGQKPGTSGLRKKVAVFREGNYLANFIQSLFDALPADKVKGSTILVSGDGRYWNKEAIQIIAEIAAGNSVGRLWIGKNGWVSTPAASAIIREREGGVCYGGILLTASHNPGGPTEDFGVKYNCANGGPAPEWLTTKIYENTLKIADYKVVELPPLDLTKIGTHKVTDYFTVEVIDPVEDWLKLMKQIFDFDLLRGLISNENFNFVYDGLNGIAGPYARAIFVDELGASEKCLLQCEPLEDFGGCHPDPNLTYADKLCDLMQVKTPESVDSTTPMFGAAGDGDNDRNMILGRGWFVTPSDSVAIIASYATKCIPYFQKGGLKGVARSMPTSMSLKNVAQKLKIDHYEVPTGWKFFGNLMDNNQLSICGEESFGTGSDHVREKDGLWAVLAWMSILAYRNSSDEKCPSPFVTVRQINEEFWKEYGRNYYTRYDYENIDPVAANKVIDHVQNIVVDSLDTNPSLSETTRQYLRNNPISQIKMFDYTDPVDQSVSKNQGLIVTFKDSSRFVLRLSGTGSSGATIRLYMEKAETDPAKMGLQTAEAMEEIVGVATDISGISKFTSRNHPTVIT